MPRLPLAHGLLVAVLVLSSCLDGAASAQGFGAARAAPHPLTDERLFITLWDGPPPGGSVVAIDDTSPWALETIGPTDGGWLLRHFGSHLYVVNTFAGTLTRLRLKGGAPPQVFDLGESSEPQDVRVVGTTAWVSRRASSRLLRIDLTTGATSESLDLSALGAHGESASLGTLEVDGDRLIVQVGLLQEDSSLVTGPFPDRAVLGVVDLPSLTLVDADPREPGPQGIALDGGPPHLKMQIIDSARRLYVSTASSFMDDRGGIEIVDLDALERIGYALSEEHIADLGGFVMTSTEGGYFVFHTDIIASTHLMPFTVAGGPGAGPELVVLFGVVDHLAYDPVRRRIYLPGAESSLGESGLFAFDTLTNLPAKGSPYPTGGDPADVLFITESP